MIITPRQPRDGSTTSRLGKVVPYMLPEERIGLVEEEDRLAVLCLSEDARDVLLGFADVL